MQEGGIMGVVVFIVNRPVLLMKIPKTEEISERTRAQAYGVVTKCLYAYIYFPSFLLFDFPISLLLFHSGLNIAADQYTEGWQPKKGHKPQEGADFSPLSVSKCVGSANDSSKTVCKSL